MSTNKKLRTPIIKPRTQGGTFYTFGSAMEDIGLNINEKSNRAELSHYVLLNLPQFTLTNVFDTSINGTYTTNKGDYAFAESFQDYVLNMETVLRNQDTYNYSANKTVSERVFWKWVFRGKTTDEFDSSNGYYTEHNTNESITKGFGRIYSGAQRSDEYGLYNETFVQIPSSYGQMRVFFQQFYDENYKVKTGTENAYKTSTVITNNVAILENITSSEYSATSPYNLNATGIPVMGIFDASGGTSANYHGNMSRPMDFFEAKLDIATLSSIYNNDNLTYDNIGFGNVVDPISGEQASDFLGDYAFNAILVYYSIYDSTGVNCLATNAYGVYLLDNAMSVSGDSSTFVFPTLQKKKTTTSADGTSFSFRVNIKPSSAYSGDITVCDNSTAAFSMAEDFNNMLRNLNAAITALKSNSRVLQKISDDNDDLRTFATDTMDKVTTLEQSIEELKTNGYLCQSCDLVVSYPESSVITDSDHIDILNGVYKNLRLDDGTVVTRSVVSGTTDKVYLMFDKVVVSNQVNKIRRTICGFSHTTSPSESYTVLTPSYKEQTI